MPLPWVRFWVDGILDGTTADELESDEIGVWLRLLALGGRYFKEGRSEGLIPGNAIASLPRLFRITPELSQRTLSKLASPKVDKIIMYEDGSILITNFKKYQPLHRELYSKDGQSCTKVDKVGQQEREIEQEREEEIEREENPPGGCNKASHAVQDVLKAMKLHLGYPDKLKEDPIPNYGVEGQAIKRMLTRGFLQKQIIGLWKEKVDQRHEFVSMHWVNQDIGNGVIAESKDGTSDITKRVVERNQQRRKEMGLPVAELTEEEKKELA